jgi:hypothetical protein
MTTIQLHINPGDAATGERHGLPWPEVKWRASQRRAVFAVASLDAKVAPIGGLAPFRYKSLRSMKDLA